MAKPNFEITVDLLPLESRYSDAALADAQVSFAMAVAKRMEPRVPFDEGYLKDSEPLASDYEKGDLIWDEPYANRVYNLDKVRTVKNPLATPHWGEVVKAEELPEIIEDARAIMNKRGSQVAR